MMHESKCLKCHGSGSLERDPEFATGDCPVCEGNGRVFILPNPGLTSWPETYRWLHDRIDDDEAEDIEIAQD